MTWEGGLHEIARSETTPMSAGTGVTKDFLFFIIISHPFWKEKLAKECLKENNYYVWGYLKTFGFISFFCFYISEETFRFVVKCTAWGMAIEHVGCKGLNVVFLFIFGSLPFGTPEKRSICSVFSFCTPKKVSYVS